MMLSPSPLLRTRNIVDNICIESQNTRLRAMTFFSNILPFIR